MLFVTTVEDVGPKDSRKIGTPAHFVVSLMFFVCPRSFLQQMVGEGDHLDASSIQQGLVV